MATFEEIKQLAYKFWEQEGRPEGKDVEHYLRAKAILDRQEAERVYQLAAPQAVSELPPGTNYAALPSPLAAPGLPGKGKRATNRRRHK